MTDSVPVRVVAVGDIMLGRGVKEANVTDAACLLAPEVMGALEGDIVTGNLECLVGTKGTPNPVSHSHFQGSPDFARPLVEKFDVVTVANNHLGDFGDEAIEETLRWLHNIGVAYVGIGRSVAEATAPVVYDIRGKKIAVFGATTVGTIPTTSAYKMACPGPELYRTAAKFIGSDHTCVLHLHAGGGDIAHPSPATRHLIKELLDVGFALILGHHPHIIQGFEVTPSHAVFYSLGDFLFDKLDSGRDRAILVTAFLQKCEVADSINIEIVIDIVQRLPNLHLSLLTGDERSVGVKALNDLSALIASGASDKAYIDFRGSKFASLIRSFRRDFQAGGMIGLISKLRRINRRKLFDLIFRA